MKKLVTMIRNGYDVPLICGASHFELFSSQRDRNGYVGRVTHWGDFETKEEAMYAAEMRAFDGEEFRIYFEPRGDLNARSENADPIASFCVRWLPRRIVA